MDQAFIEKVKKLQVYEPISDDSYRTIPQSALTYCGFPDDVKHNAIWDFTVLDDGRVFFSLCAEEIVAMYVRLYEYLPETNTFKLHFQLEDKVFQFPRAISTSKIHSSIHKMKDGRLIMTTHTTAKSPVHDVWLPRQYYSHLWEGYQGSIVIIYDPETGVFENRGIPVPRESIYGGVYDEKHHAFYFTGYFRGHLYRLDIATNELKDYGQVTEYGSFRLHVGPDGHVYGNSRSGNVYRVNTDTLEIEDIATFPLDENDPWAPAYRQIHFAVNGPDGYIYLAVYWHPQLIRLDPKTGEITLMGTYAPDVDVFNQQPRVRINAMDMDDNGVLWYLSSMSTGNRLCKWDVLRGGKPQYLGMLGPKERISPCASEMLFHNGKFYISETNHSWDPPAVMVLDPEKLEAALAAGEDRPMSEDPYNYMFFKDGEKQFPLGEDEYFRLQEKIQYRRDVDSYLGAFRLKNYPELKPHSTSFVRVWREIGTPYSQVKRIRWADNDTVIAQCESGGKCTELTIVNGKLTGHTEIAALDAAPTVPEALQDLAYPVVPGRQYKSTPVAACPLSDGRWLVGTGEATVGIVKDGRVFSLGACAPHGPIRGMTSDGNGTAYGVAGDPMDQGMVFRYTDEGGLEQLGCVFADTYDDPESLIYGSFELSCCALSPDGTKLAIGAEDRMGMVYIFNVK